MLDPEEYRKPDASHGLDGHDAVLHRANVLREHDVDAGVSEHRGLFRQLWAVLRRVGLRRRDAPGDVGVGVDRVAASTAIRPARCVYSSHRSAMSSMPTRMYSRPNRSRRAFWSRIAPPRPCHLLPIGPPS